MMSFKSIVRQLSSSAFVRKVAKFQVGFMVTIGVGMLSSVVYPSLLGLEQFGLYALTSALAGLLSIPASFGQDTTLIIFMSEAVGKKDHAAIRRVMAYYFQATIAATVIYAVLIALTPLIAASRGTAEIGTYTQWILLNVALQAPIVLFVYTLQMSQRIGLISILESVRNFLQFGVSSVLLLMGYGIMGILVGTAAVSVAFIVCTLPFYNRFADVAGFPRLGDIIRSAGMRGTGTYFIQGLGISVDRNVTANVHPNLLLTLLSATAPLEAVGIARLALRLATLPSTILSGSISRVASVSVPQILAKDRKHFGSAAVKLILGCVGLHALAVLGAAIFVPPLVPYVYGREFIGVIPAFLVMVPLSIFTSSHVISIPLLRLSKKIYLSTINFIIGLAIATGIYLLLYPIIDPALAFGIAVLYVHVHGTLIYLYVWYYLFKKLPTFKSVSSLIGATLNPTPHASADDA
jgi:O-antigen/teichoic acid export membrane protein